MNQELQIKIDGREAKALMFKYKIEEVTSTLSHTLSHKFVNEVMPKVDQFFVTH